MRKTLLILALSLTSVLFSEISENKLNQKIAAKIVQTHAEENFAFSPACISQNIVSILLGSAGETRKEIERALGIAHVTIDFDLLNENLQLLKSINGISTTHSLWIDKNCSLLPSYSKALFDTYQSEVSHIDFSKPSKVSRKINEFISRKTDKKITNVLSKNDIGASDKLLIASAIDLNLEFRKPFQKAYTQNNMFYGNEKTSIAMMNQKGSFLFSKDEDFMTCSLPLICEQGKVTLLLFLPIIHTEKPLQLLHQKVNASENGLFSLITGLTHRKMHLRLPKFSFESKIYLDSSLKRLGVSDAYSMHANFSNISTDMNLALSKNIQSNFVSINERGVSASSASTSSFTFKSTRDVFHPMHFNRPFAFAVVEQNSEQILMLGQYTTPIKDTYESDD